MGFFFLQSQDINTETSTMFLMGPPTMSSAPEDLIYTVKEYGNTFKVSLKIIFKIYLNV